MCYALRPATYSAGRVASAGIGVAGFPMGGLGHGGGGISYGRLLGARTLPACRGCANRRRDYCRDDLLLKGVGKPALHSGVRCRHDRRVALAESSILQELHQVPPGI